MPSDRNAERTVAKTYVPASQKERWREHADELDMSQSEFLRSMVQAGRRGFELDSTEPDSAVDPAEPAPADTTPGGDALEERVLGLLNGEPRSWDELLEGLTEGLEDRLEATLQRLQEDGRVRYSGREGGYTTIEGDGD
jgi:hypothetical protein